MAVNTKIISYQENFEEEIKLVKEWARETGNIKFTVDIDLQNGVNHIEETIINTCIQTCYFMAQEYFINKDK